jgi:hypothetical protein
MDRIDLDDVEIEVLSDDDDQEVDTDKEVEEGNQK